jgi:hypothetical protein
MPRSVHLPRVVTANVGSSYRFVNPVAFLAVIMIWVASNLRGERLVNTYEQVEHLVIASHQVSSQSPVQISKKITPYRYFEVNDQIMEMANKKSPQHMEPPPSNTAFSRATVIHQAPWLPHRRMCKETCCVQAVAISLDQDKQQLIHCRDGIDLADIHLALYNRRDDYRRFHAAIYNEALLPCLVPGTIINTEHFSLFWAKQRAQIHVPYAVMTMGSDTDTPWGGETYLADPLLLRWYGNNPILKDSLVFRENKKKFQPMNLGLSGYNHPQERYMLPLQKINNFTNPFLDKSRWDLSKTPLDFDKDVFVHFGSHDRGSRGNLYQSLCASNAVLNTTSCSSGTNQVPIYKVYSDMSRFRFGVSPRGNGWDCYRTYEMLYLGIIPIVQARDSYSHELFEGLPVIIVPHLGESTTRQSIMAEIGKYIASDAFQNGTFVSGWERLFFHHRRRQVLKDTGRDKEILVDENGREYYQAYHYTALGEEHGKYTACLSPDAAEKCKVPEESEKKFNMLIQNPPEMSEDDKNWLAEWEARGKILPHWEFHH